MQLRTMTEPSSLLTTVVKKSLHLRNRKFPVLDGKPTIKWRSANRFCVNTSVSKRLLPKEIAQFLSPRLFYILAGALQSIRVARFPLAEPYLKLGGRIGDHGCESDVRRLYAMLVDVNIQVLQSRFTNINVRKREEREIYLTDFTFLSGKRRALLKRIKSSNRNTCRRHFFPFPCHTRNSFCRNSLPCSFTFTCNLIF